MSKPIIVAYDANTSDRAPVDFGVAAARFTGAPLIIASVSAVPARAASMTRTWSPMPRECSGT